MAYVKNIWVDQDVERPKTYEVTNNQDGSITLTDSFGLVTELGTPVNATNMNHIEDGLALSDVMKYSSTVTYSLDEWVTGTVNGTKGIYKSLINNNIGNALTDTTKWEEVSLGSSLKLGQSVWAPDPLIDSDLHLYNGSQYATDGIYADFVTRYLTPLKTDYPTRFKTEAEWQTINTQYGACGFWVLDTENNVFRFPNIVGIIENTTTEADLGKLTEAGLPNITGTIFHGVTDGYTNVDNGFIGASLYSSNNRASGSLPFRVENWSFDASHSSALYGNSNTVQPQTISGYLYCVVATDQTPTEAETDINEIATDLALKADVDLTNATNSAKILMASMGMPSSTNIDLTLGSSGTGYIAPSDGYFSFVSGNSGSYPKNVELENLTSNISSSAQNSVNSGWLRCCIPAKKGDTVNVWYQNLDFKSLKFVYAQGSESEA